MRRQSNTGFTLIELLIVITIIALLAAALVPNLLAARGRAHDTATVSCLKQLATTQEAARADHPFTYDNTVDPAEFPACQGITLTEEEVLEGTFTYTGYHPRGRNEYTVGTGTSVVVTLVGGLP